MDENLTLAEARKILATKMDLLKKYPHKFSLRLSVRQWSLKVAKLEKIDDTTTP